jgi:hypothetical protein
MFSSQPISNEILTESAKRGDLIHGSRDQNSVLHRYAVS